MGNRGNACLLQSINLYSLVRDKFTEEAYFDYGRLEELTRLSIRMMNETQAMGYERLPLDINKQNVDDWNSIGLGIMGLADMFIAMGVKYGDKKSLDLVSKIFDKMNLWALDESANIAKEKGTFKKYQWKYTKESPLIKALLLSEDGKKVYNNIKKNGLANGSLLACAPTGSLALMFGKLSGGVEPIFKCYYERSTHSMEDGKGGQATIKVYSRSVEDLLKYNNLPLKMPSDGIKKRFPYVVESHDIAPKDRIAVQAIMQEYIDNAISSTINLKESATVEDIKDIYMTAWKQGLKGVTIFRDGCKRGNILGVSKKEETTQPKMNSVVPASRRGIEAINGTTYRYKTACVDKFYITVNKDDGGNIFEVFSSPSSGCSVNINNITRLISIALRSGVKVEEIIKDLRVSKCPACQALKNKGYKDIEWSCGSAIARALENSYGSTVVQPVVKSNCGDCGSCKQQITKCPECGAEGSIRPEAHCWVCSKCGASGCN